MPPIEPPRHDDDDMGLFDLYWWPGWALLVMAIGKKASTRLLVVVAWALGIAIAISLVAIDILLRRG